jgi:hypothetical protein
MLPCLGINVFITTAYPCEVGYDALKQFESTKQKVRLALDRASSG